MIRATPLEEMFFSRLRDVHYFAEENNLKRFAQILFFLDLTVPFKHRTGAGLLATASVILRKIADPVILGNHCYGHFMERLLFLNFTIPLLGNCFLTGECGIRGGGRMA